MENLNLILLITAVVIILVFFKFRGRREKYVYENALLDNFKKTNKFRFSTYDGITRIVSVKVVNNKVITIEATDKETNTPSYITVIENRIDTTPVANPQGEYLFNIIKALNGDEDMYSLLLGDTTRALYLDVTNDAMGTIDIKGLKNLDDIKEPRSLNFKLTPI
jgi:hypothetical protein